MNRVKKYLFYALIVLSTALILLTLLSLVKNLKLWYFKILDFPRLQYLVLGILLLLLFSLTNKKWKWPSLFLYLGLIVAISIQAAVIYPYYLGEKTVPDFDSSQQKPKDTFGLLLANVLIDNRNVNSFLTMVHQQNPDLLLVMEVDDWWNRALQGLKKKYPYHLEYPLSNAYGMSLYSKFPLDRMELTFLKHSDVPSFQGLIPLPSGKVFRFYAIHPVAPVPSSKYPDNVGEEAIALLKIGNLVAENPMPSLVAGDFNDVSWSYTSRNFGEQGNLQNVRIGRGLYNTYNANSNIFRWPLDHFFTTKEFKLVELKRLPKFGSDHFPLYAEFVLDP